MAGFGIVGLLLTLLLFAAVAAATVAMLRGTWRPAGHHDSEEVLAERYAHGDIDDEEYQRRLRVLRAR